MDQFASVGHVLDTLRQRKFVIVVDDESRENEGDLVMAAEHITADTMAFIIRHTGGVVCLSLSNKIADHLDLPAMVEKNTSKRATPYTVSIESKDVDTGISAADRAKTVLRAIDPATTAADLARPGHVFPLRAHDGGVLVRAGHTEASVDLCKLAGLRAGAVISELMHDNGTMMRLPAIHQFAAEHDIPVISVADIITWRRRTECLIEKEAETELETTTGMWNLRVYKDRSQNREHVALIKGTIRADDAVLVRVHSECLTGDVFHSQHCDCGAQLNQAMQRIADEGQGVLLYMRQEGRGIGLVNKILAYELQRKEGLDTAEANVRLGLPVDLREYGIGAQILRDIGVGKMRLLTNNPKKMVGLEAYGLTVSEQLPIEISPLSDRQRKYLRTKKEKMGHTLNME